MKISDQEIGNLLALKRHEGPPESYMEDFLREFHQRRREEAVRGSRVSVLWQRFTDWLSEPGLAKWAYGAGVAYAAVLAIVISMPRGQEVESIVPEAVDHRVVAPVENVAPTQLDELDLRPSSEGKIGEQEF
ncbi:hypothetical protein HAHE_00540 [Haloferula helveola]|uniref:Uncharacterized protein n=1 Tax=Haloferula helveola TaxID=490095 RepID=A0ABM7R6K7_9BACT|nr:hypothetical protein HAHE_00540 [Haloferula helveola]